MDTFFNPKGIAVFGLSPSPKNVARTIIQNLKTHGFSGDLVGIGSKKSSTLGVPIYSSIVSIKETIDLAVVVTPSSTVIRVLKECHQVGIHRAIIMTAGFEELRGGDDELSGDLARTAADLGIRFIGPNCQGVINTETGVCLPFGRMLRDELKAGDISIISQSGSISWMTCFLLSHELLGVNKVVSIGNKMNIDEVDILRYFIQDTSTRMIVLHLESTVRGRELFQVLAGSPKPVVLFKTQVSPQSARVAYSHTAALADDERVVSGACRQAGVMRAQTFRQMIDLAKALALPPLGGNRLGIVSASGGVGITAADTCKRFGMELASLPETCLEKIRSFPRAKVINLTNPIDTGNIYDNRVNLDAMRIVVGLDNVDGGVLSQFVSSTGDYFENVPSDYLVQEAARLAGTEGKPIALHFLCHPRTREQIKRKSTYPIFDTMEDAVEALHHLWKCKRLERQRQRWNEPVGAESLPPFSFSSRLHPDAQGFRLLSQYHIPCEEPVVLSTESDILAEADRRGYPLALKALSPDFTHKGAHEAVALNLGTREALAKALVNMADTLARKGLRVAFFLLQKMVSPGPELILGGKHDPHYGPVILLGHGGTAVEERAEVLCYMAPVSLGMAKDMLKGIMGSAGDAGDANSALAEAVVRFSQLVADNSHIQEIDLNPVRLVPDEGRFTVLDVRVKLGID